ncbi:MAG: carbamoyltransferase HypF, partial [Phaeodactylibacter sp.]|nr:carbamoyltransferase HypF [Phaeodactylibacter sp.]
MNTWHIHIEGQVQGVGFRPLVYRRAQALGLKGWVSNSSDGLHITFNADSTGAQSFYQTLLEQPPPLAKIQSHQLEELPMELFEDFQIVGSSRKAAASLLITPDVALCPDCRQELHATKDRRYQYAFNTCTNCGPRFSILERLPYDREQTTMAPFEMCPDCAAEYKDPYNRRHYSQTNSCPDCGIQLRLWDAEAEWKEGDQVTLLDQVVQAWEAGKIVALKGIGGYLLTCDANNETAIQTLRNRKQRPTKPFAVLFPNLEMVERHLQIQPIEAEYLSGPIAPIVLLEQHEKSASILALDAIAPGLKQIGVMLPYAPLYELLLSRFGRPIIATSGNVSKTPIIYQDDKALEQLSILADLILQHNRAIVLPQDDSVLKIARQSGHPLWYRRSRGLAPTYIQPELDWPKQTWLAVGADLKSTFGLLHRQNTYISPYLGNQEDLESQ